MQKVIADATFYICFLDDIKKPEYLVKLIENFTFVIGKVLKDEIEKSQNYRYIENFIGKKIEFFEYENYGEILKPFFSSEEIKKGEQEVIAMAIILIRMGANIVLIIDDKGARNLIKKNFPKIYKATQYTVKFIEECYSKYGIFMREEVIEMLQLIKNSKFIIKNKIIYEVLRKIERR